MFTKVEIIRHPATLGVKLADLLRLADCGRLRNLQTKRVGSKTLKINYGRPADPFIRFLQGLARHSQVFQGDLQGRPGSFCIEFVSAYPQGFQPCGFTLGWENHHR